MNAPAFDAKFAAINKANDRVAKAQKCIDLLRDYQKHTIEGVTSKSSRFWEEVRTYQLADAMSALSGCDTFEQMQEAASDELRTEHSYDIREEMNLDSDGFATDSFVVTPRVTSMMGG